MVKEKELVAEASSSLRYVRLFFRTDYILTYPKIMSSTILVIFLANIQGLITNNINYPQLKKGL